MPGGRSNVSFSISTPSSFRALSQAICCRLLEAHSEITWLRRLPLEAGSSTSHRSTKQYMPLRHSTHSRVLHAQSVTSNRRLGLAAEYRLYTRSADGVLPSPYCPARSSTQKCLVQVSPPNHPEEFLISSTPLSRLPAQACRACGV